MDYPETCPSCASDDITVNRKRNTLECNNCGFRGAASGAQAEAPDAAKVHLSPAGDPYLVDFCRRLAEAPEVPWVQAVIDDWPGPIAHEYERLRHILGEGQIIGALWQLKDLTEVLIRFPALVMARDLLASSERGELSDHARAELRALAREVRRTLLGPPLTLGSWLALAATTLATPIQRAPEWFLFPEIAGLFRGRPASATQGPKATRLAKELDALTEIRNRIFGHGALQLDFSEVRKALAEHVPRLNRLLAEHADLWSGTQLRIGTPDGEVLTGAATIRHHHDHAEPAAHILHTEPLWLISEQRQLRLAPYMALRRCNVCAKQDAFLYDWRRLRDEGRDRYGFVDFLAGHAMAWPWHADAELHAETKGLVEREAPAVSSDSVVQDYACTQVARLLEERALEAHYLSPGYLREPLAAFIDTHERGVFWLQAPAHVGKSLFVSGLDPRLRAELKEDPLREDLAVVAFYVRREYQGFREQFRDQLQLRLREAFGIEPQRRGLPLLDLQAADPSAAFANWIGAFLAIGGKLDERLLVCIDGLDELRPEPDGSILDFLPSSEALPNGVYLLLTSRPLEECPGWVREGLGARYDAPTACHRLQVGLAHLPYRELLARYVDARLRPRLEALASSRMKEVLTGTRMPDEGPTAALPRGLRETFSSEWRRLQAEHGQAGTPIPLPERTLGALLGELADLRAQVVDKAEGRFLYVSYLTDLLADHTLPLAAVDRLPPAEQLFEHYLAELERIQSDKPNALLRRVLLHLAAAEEAHWEDAKTLPAVALEDWRGLPLDVLSELVEGRGGDDISQDLVYTLYSLKALLGTWKGDDTEHARFRLGLKGTAEAIRQRWPQALEALHRTHVTRLVERPAVSGEQQNILSAPPLPEVSDEYLLRYVLAHARLSEELGGVTEVFDSAETLSQLFGERFVAAYGNGAYRAAIAWVSQQLIIVEAALRNSGSSSLPNWKSQMAASFQNRGLALAKCGDSNGALNDFDHAIALGESLRETLGPQWPPVWQNQMAGAYQCRGLTLADLSVYESALADYGKAIALYEDLRKALGTECDPAWQNNLVAAHQNRGNILADRGDSEAALADFDRAIALGENLQKELGTHWPAAWQNDLSVVFQNRGNFLVKLGANRAALNDFDEAISLGEDLRQSREISGLPWPPAWQNDLARAYQNRAGALGDNQAAIADYDEAVTYYEMMRRSLGSQCPPAWKNDLAACYRSRATTLANLGENDTALVDHTRAISVAETLRQALADQWPPAWQNDLAACYASRGDTLANLGDNAAAMADLEQAIELAEALRYAFGDQWPTTWKNDLASTYSRRGTLFHERGDNNAALEDYGRSIFLAETLRDSLGDQYPPAWQNDLAQFYQNRSVTLHDCGDIDAALADIGRAIALSEELREALGSEWLPTWQNDLAGFYQNRGVTLASQGQSDSAISDFDHAIVLREGLRQMLGSQYPPSWQNNLARAYQNRGVARYNLGDNTGAASDYGRAIALAETLRQAFGNQYPPAWQNDLARVYQNRGAALHDYGEENAALADYGRAIDIMEALRVALGAQWPPAWESELAGMYQNRGVALYDSTERDAAVADYDRAIEIGEDLGKALRSQWPPAWQNQLSTVYRNRGNALAKRGDIDEALASYGQAIFLGEALRESLGPQWPTAWQINLASIYQNRGIVFAQEGRRSAAIQEWKAAASLHRDLLEEGAFSSLVPYLELQRWVLDAGIADEDWATGASALTAFMGLVKTMEQKIEEAATNRGRAGEEKDAPRPWEDEVAGFMELVQGFSARQRAEILAQLGDDDAEWVATSLGWN